jgi:hypothetical protein
MLQKMTAHLQWQKIGAKVTHEVICLPDKYKLEMILTPDGDSSRGTRSEGTR